MKTFRLMAVLLLIGMFGFEAGAAGALTIKINAKAGNSALPDGTKVFFTIGGEGCPCQGAGSAVTRGGGFATSTFTVNCDGPGRPEGTIDTKKCKVFATASVESGGSTTFYRGNGTLTQIKGLSPPTFKTTFTIKP
ncbi:MAG: hypothetical protein L0229_28100 [Blastocatellia bacterium]|nr:hypothetical protein [Blastocatellia bacterium]